MDSLRSDIHLVRTRRGSPLDHGDGSELFLTLHTTGLCPNLTTWGREDENETQLGPDPWSHYSVLERDSRPPTSPTPESYNDNTMSLEFLSLDLFDLRINRKVVFRTIEYVVFSV